MPHVGRHFCVCLRDAATAAAAAAAASLLLQLLLQPGAGAVQDQANEEHIKQNCAQCRAAQPAEAFAQLVNESHFVATAFVVVLVVVVLFVFAGQ